MNKNLTPFGRDVKVKLVEQGLTQRELAQAVGTSLTFLSQILYGHRPGAKYIGKIAALLRLDETKYVA